MKYSTYPFTTLLCQGKARRQVPPFNMHCLQYLVENEEWRVLTLGSLYLSCCEPNTCDARKIIFNYIFHKSTPLRRKTYISLKWNKYIINQAIYSSTIIKQTPLSLNLHRINLYQIKMTNTVGTL